MAVSTSLNVQWRTNSRRSVGGSNSVAICASVSCCRRISRVCPDVKTGRPADPGQGVDEHAASDAEDAATVALVMPPSSGAGLAILGLGGSPRPAPSVLGLSAYATKIGRSLVPADFPL